MKSRFLMCLLSVVLVLSLLSFTSCNGESDPTEPTAPVTETLDITDSITFWERTPAGFTKGLHLELLNSETHQEKYHIPIYKITTNEGSDQLQVLPDDSNSILKDFDEKFLEENIFLIVRFEAPSGSIEYGIKKLEKNGNALCLYVYETYSPVTVDAMCMPWSITVAVKKDAIKDITSFDAILEE